MEIAGKIIKSVLNSYMAWLFDKDVHTFWPTITRVQIRQTRVRVSYDKIYLMSRINVFIFFLYIVEGYVRT